MNYQLDKSSKLRSSGCLSLAIALAFPWGSSPSFAQIIPVETKPSTTSSPAPSNPPASQLPSDKPNDKAANPSDNKNARFSCQVRDGQYIVVYQPKSQPQKYFPWAAPSAMGDGWSPERRCNEISRRLESYRPDGLLEMRTSTENGYNVICVTTDKNPTCRIVLTVPNGQDPISTRDKVFGNLTTADSGQTTIAVNTYSARRGSLSLSSLGKVGKGGFIGIVPSNLPSGEGNLSIVDNVPIRLPNDGWNSLTTSSSYKGNGLYLKPYLDPSDGGTGAILRNSSFKGV
ncbi:MAG: COP23 domain-containing protein [Pseudanabaena sp.]